MEEGGKGAHANFMVVGDSCYLDRGAALLIHTDVRASQILCHSFHLRPNFVRLVFTNVKLDPSPPWNLFFEGLIKQKS